MEKVIWVHGSFSDMANCIAEINKMLARGWKVKMVATTNGDTTDGEAYFVLETED